MASSSLKQFWIGFLLVPVMDMRRSRRWRAVHGLGGLLLCVGVLLIAGGGSASAASTNKVLILAGTVTGGSSSIEATEAAAQGMAVDIVDAATWSSMTSAQFASYRAIILGDPTCYGPGTSPDINAAAANAKTWGPVINGNIVILGTDPVFHASQGGATVTQRGVDFALAQAGRTGAYIALSCYYHETVPNTPVPLLDGIGPGGFTVTGVGCYNNAHIVAASPALAGLSDAELSNWSCSVHEAFQTWPGSLVPLAIAKDFSSSFTASDGTQGPPYILAGGDIRSFPLSLSPLSDSAPPGTAHTVTATLLDDTTRAPVQGGKIGFDVISGPNTGVVGSCNPASCLTRADGTVSWTYTSNRTLGADRIRAYYDLNGNGIADVGEPQTTAGMEWVVGSGPVAAIGDSYISGEGTFNRDISSVPVDYYGGEEGGSAYPQAFTVAGFNPDSASASDRCHRSPVSFAPQLGVEEPNFVACSGATIGEIESGSKANGEPSQLNVLEPADSVVLLSAGGDDLGFSSVLSACIDGPFGQHQSTNTGCKKAVFSAEDKISTMQQSLTQLVAKIRAPAGAPDAQIVQIGYPRLYPSGGTGSTCSGINSVRQRLLNFAADQVDTALQATDSSLGVTFIDTRGVFAQHELCSGSPYVNDLQLNKHFGPFGPNNCPDDYTVRGLREVCSQSFHPNTLGYLAEAQYISQQLPFLP